ncbi:hypothetical protein [uncultured Mucilaginibacter sp.]|uniref:hypothetical protein n=1 Tax=uncultured Mucilaginibacter sp. TaxID=797541 RepID=UPI0025F84C99|nr:hypothetical protein [uncultured Mucilaginibacter sp.]
MTKEAIIEKTVRLLDGLAPDKVQEIADFVEYISIKQDESELQSGIQYLVSNSDTFSFLNDDEDIYSLNDLKEKF